MAISEPTLQRLVEHYHLAPPHQVVLVWNGIDVDRFLQPVENAEVAQFRQENGLRGEPIIGSIARLSPVKGLDLLLKAVPSLLEEFPRLQVLLVGEGPARDSLVRLAYELGIAGHVVLTHSVRDTRVPLSLMQAFVAPAWQEGFGLAIVEAMAAGVPVVVTDSGGPTHLIEDGRSGFVVPVGDPQAISGALRRLLRDCVFRSQMAQWARQRAKERFDVKREVEEVEAVYARAVA